MASEIDSQPRPRKGGLFGVLVFAVVALVVLGAFALIQRRSQYQALAKETETRAIPTVAVIHPVTEPTDEGLVLPGSMQAYVESPIYARTNGYLKKWYRDIGSRVRRGELLADIDTPEVDQQLIQAKADLETSKANANLSHITATRYEDLLKSDSVSKQEVDSASGDLAAKQATVASAEANVHRLYELESFKHIYAPFSGVITRRNVDIGTLVNALLFRSEGLRAVTVDANHQLHLQPLTIGRDYGVTLEVLQGLRGCDWIVLNPADSLEEGQHVNVKEASVKPAAPPSAAPSGSGSSANGDQPSTEKKK